MKRISTILIISLIIACSKSLPEISTKDGFGNLKLETNLEEFVLGEFDIFKTKTMSAYPNGNFSMEFDSLKVTKDVTLKGVNLMFYQNSLGLIVIESSEEIFDVLEKQNGIAKDFTDDMGKRQVIFSTESNKVECKYEKSANQKGTITFCIVK